MMTETKDAQKTGNVTSLDIVVEERMSSLKIEIAQASYTSEQQKVAGEILICLKNIGEKLSASIINPFKRSEASCQLDALYKRNSRQQPLINYFAERMFQQTDVYNRYIVLKNNCGNVQNGNGKKFK